MSPKQKSDLVQLMKDFDSSKVILAVGDGANDVSMIANAHVGVGICGKEGSQAANTSDYAISQFKYLTPLLLHHGNNSYRRNGYLLSYSFFKNFVYISPVVGYAFLSGFSAQTFYDLLLHQLFNLVPTCLPIVVYALLDQKYTRA